MNRIVFGMILAVLVLLPGNVAAEHHIFYLDPVDNSCDPGNDVTVWVMVNTSNSDINSFQASIIFDPSVVNVTLVERGTPAWYSWGWNIFDCSDYSCEEGKKIVKIGGAELLGGYGPGDLQLGKMTLHGEANGISSLHFANESEAGVEHKTQIANTSAGIICGQYGNDCTMIDGTFTCGGVQTFTKDLPAGWNLISLPLDATDNSTTTVLSGVTRNAVKQYNATSKQFETATTMDPGTGYFVHVTSASTWSYQGMPESSTSTELKSGLNMIGVPNCTIDVGTAMGSTDYRYVARWNTTAQKFEVYNPNAPPAFHHFTTMEAGEGYFVSAKTGGTLTVTCP